MITLRMIETSESLIHVYVAHCAVLLSLGGAFGCSRVCLTDHFLKRRLGTSGTFNLKLQALKESVENWGYKLNLKHFGDM